MRDGTPFLCVAADRIGAPGSARIAGKNAIPRHQRRQLVLDHPDRREDGRHSKANCTSRGFQPHSTGWEGSIWGIPAKSFGSGRPRKAFFVRKEAKPHGMRKQIEGHPPEAGSEAILFEDVTTTGGGGSAMVAVDALREIGCEVKTIYTIVDRREGAGARFDKIGIQLVPLFTKDEFAEA